MTEIEQMDKDVLMIACQSYQNGLALEEGLLLMTIVFQNMETVSL